MRCPQISVLMTVYNEERFLSQALDSLLAQTCKDFELIIVNDGSTDGTQAIIEQYAVLDSRIKPVHLQKQGRVKSLNRAIELAQGDYLAVMDSDDIALPMRLQKGLEYLENHPEAGMVGSYYAQIDRAGKMLKLLDSIPVEPAELKRMLLTDNPICHGTVMFRRSMVITAGLYREHFQAAMDYDLYLRVLDHYEIGLIPEVLYQYRVHGSSISSRRLLQLQMKSLAQFLKRQRDAQGRDSLQTIANPDEQQAFLQQFFKSDLKIHRKTYARQLFEAGRKYYRMGDIFSAIRLFKLSLSLDPARFRTLKYLGKSYLKKLLSLNINGLG